LRAGSLVCIGCVGCVGLRSTDGERLTPKFSQLTCSLSSWTDRFEHFKAEHVYREFNTHADRLSNEACAERTPWQLSMAEDAVRDGKKKRKRADLEATSDQEDQEDEGDRAQNPPLT